MKSVKKAISAKVEATGTPAVATPVNTAKKTSAPQKAGKAVAEVAGKSGSKTGTKTGSKTGSKAGSKAKKVALKSSSKTKAEPAPAKATKAAEPVKKAQASTKPKTSPARPKTTLASAEEGTAKVLESTVAYQGPLFRVQRDRLIEPGGTESVRDVIRHNGSVVILAVDPAKKKKHKKDPWVVIERQYRHAAGQFLWELPAGKLDAGESPLEGAKRELGEETGYSAKQWSPLVEYFASPGFLGESMKVFLAEGLIAGEAHPEEDEKIDFRLVRLSELLEMVDAGKIIDGKTLTTVLLYARQLGLKRKK